MCTSSKHAYTSHELSLLSFPALRSQRDSYLAHIHRHIHILNDLFCFLGLHSHTTKTASLYVSGVDVFCHSSAAGKSSVHHGAALIQCFFDTAKFSPWTMLFDLLETEETPWLYSLMRSCNDFCEVPRGLQPGICSQMPFTLRDPSSVLSDSFALCVYQHVNWT